MVFVTFLISEDVSAGSCFNYVKDCTNSEICFYSVQKSSNKWETLDAWKGHVKEAKRRGLACGVKVSKQKLWEPLKTAFVKLSSKDRKTVQTILKDLGLYQSSIDGLYGKGTSASLATYNTKYLNSASLKKSINANKLIEAILARSVTKAADKDLVNKPNEITNTKTPLAGQQLLLTMSACEKNVRNCTGAEICERATVVKEGILKNWKAYGSQTFVFEAKNRGLTCGTKPDKLKMTAPENYKAGIEAYDAGDFKTAMEQAKLLAPFGNADAQFYLGKMYADSKGTLQRSTHAHMWFNLASANGHGAAATERDALAEKMTTAAVEKAQDLAADCMDSDYQDCSLGKKSKSNTQEKKQTSTQNKIIIKSVPPVVSVLQYSDADKAIIKSSFRGQSLLRRKQVQYALRKLGYYFSTVDGLWGKETGRAVVNYGQDSKLRPSFPSEIFGSAINEVDVPAAFVAAKTLNTVKTNTHGLTAIINKPPIPADQAWAICKPKAGLVAHDVGSRERSHIEGGRGTNCRVRDDVFGAKITCDQGSNFPGLIPLMLGIDDVSKAENIIDKAYNAALDSCLAQYGWRD